MASAVMSSAKPHVAFLGLGAMGFAMSTHLVRSGVQVTGFDIYPPTLEKWTTACQTIKDKENQTAMFASTTSPAEAVSSSGVNVVVMMVATHLHVESALFDENTGAVKSLPKDIAVIIMATIPPTYPAEVQKRLRQEYRRLDVHVIDAPVSGGTIRSANGTLTIMAASNKPEDLKHPLVANVLHTLSNNGRTFFPIPGGLGSGEAAKALNQVQCGIHIAAGSEIMVLAAHAGLNTRKFFNSLITPTTTGQSLPAGVQKDKYIHGWTWMIQNRGPRMLDPAEPLSSAISIINKDVFIIVDEEKRLGVDLPLLNTAATQIKTCMDSKIDKWDDAYISKYYLDPTLKDTTKMNKCIDQAQDTFRTTLSSDEEKQVVSTVLHAHALINLQSAYETIKFAEALDLMGSTQRKMWFTLIAGAAGGSTVFEEVIPLAFEAIETGEKWQSGFRKYVGQIAEQWKVKDVEDLVAKCKEASGNFRPVMVEQALKFFESLK